MKPTRCYAVEMVDQTEATPVLLTFDAEEAESLAETLNELRLQRCLADDDAEPAPVAVVRRALLLYQPCPVRREVVA